MAIILKNINKKYNDFKVLNEINLKLEYGKIYCLMGQSGSGKSTLLKIASGLLRPSSGNVLYDDIDIYKLSDKNLSKHRNLNVGFVFQQFFLEENLTVYENILIPLLIRGKIDKIELEKKLLTTLEQTGMIDKKDQIVKTLSGGEKQRVAIARAIVGNPKIIFADEPTGNLDSINGMKIIDLFLKLNLAGTTVLIVTHNEKISNLIENKIYIKDGIISHDD